MGKNQDLRVTKTYLALTNAFLQMMAERQFEDISVIDLCNRAMVRRATFYKHFADKYEFFTFVIRQMQARFDAQQAATPPDENPVAFYSRLFSHALSMVEENRRFIQSTLNSNMFPFLLSIVCEQIALDIRLKLKNDQALGHKMIASPEVMAVISAGALAELLRWWLTLETPVARDKLENEVARIIKAVYSAANQ